MTVGPWSVAVEREAKLVAPLALVLPDLSGVLPGVRATAGPDQRLVATYYDTPDLRLARAGCTVRHRSGEGRGPRWTVKLPAGADPSTISRREVSVDGSEARVPDLVSDLVLAIRRHDPIGRVARLETLRRQLSLVGPGDERLADVADDTVRASCVGSADHTFREVELELVDADDGARELVAAVVARLVGAGCRAGRPLPKLVRALGDPALLPADVVVPDVARDATAAELVRHALARSVAAIARHDPGVRIGDDEEEVHDFRVATRRLRSDIRSFAPLLDAARLASLVPELRWLGSLVGALRDVDVLRGRLASDLARLPRDAGRDASAVRSRLDQDAVAARGRLLAGMRDARYVRLLDALVSLASSPPIRPRSRSAQAPGADVVRAVARRPWRRLAAAAASLGDSPSDADLHRVRILAKRCRYAAEAVAPVAGSGAARFAAAVADLQTLLGDHQDSVVARSYFATSFPPGGRDAGDGERDRLVAELVAAEDARRTRLRSRWPAAWDAASAKSLRRWM
ncbi:MAG: CYTH and CHAD domain-containing protein [Actinomycetota bacterium]|nr:CYTH and CHAD domain-containing protein [Actinomycetota bacterium]